FRVLYRITFGFRLGLNYRVRLRGNLRGNLGSRLRLDRVSLLNKRRLSFASEVKIKSGVDNCFLIDRLKHVSVHDVDVFDECARVCTSDNKRNFLDVAMEHLLALSESTLRKVICVDR